MKSIVFLVIALSIALNLQGFDQIDTAYQTVGKTIIVTEVVHRTMIIMQNPSDMEFTAQEMVALMSGEIVYPVLVELFITPGWPLANDIVQGFALEDNEIIPVTAQIHRLNKTKNGSVLLGLILFFIVAIIIAGRSVIKGESRRQTLMKYIRFMTLIVLAIVLGFFSIILSLHSEPIMFNDPRPTLLILILLLFILYVINHFPYIVKDFFREIILNIIPLMIILIILGILSILGGVLASVWTCIAALTCCVIGWLIYEGFTLGTRKVLKKKLKKV